MSEAETTPRRMEGPPRIPGTPAVRPREAATLMIIRRDGPKPRMLLGRRNAGHNFMPNLWVFPGGRVDRSDFRAPHATDLNAETAAVFGAHLKPSRGRALAMAAVRETFEEVGLFLARPGPTRPGAGPWRPFLEHGVLADLDAIQVVARAITPPMVGKRFDTWFLMAEAERLTSLERQPDCGELEEIAWFDYDEAKAVNLPTVTRMMMKEALEQLEDRSRPRPYMRFRSGKPGREHL